MTRTTQRDMAGAMRRLNGAMGAAGLDIVGLSVQPGSKTYGRAFRLFRVDSATGGLSEVIGNNGFLGMTAAEAVQSLRMLAVGVELATGSPSVR